MRSNASRTAAEDVDAARLARREIGFLDPTGCLSLLAPAQFQTEKKRIEMLRWRKIGQGPRVSWLDWYSCDCRRGLGRGPPGPSPAKKRAAAAGGAGQTARF